MKLLSAVLLSIIVVEQEVRGKENQWELQPETSTVYKASTSFINVQTGGNRVKLWIPSRAGERWPEESPGNTLTQQVIYKIGKNMLERRRDEYFKGLNLSPVNILQNFVSSIAAGASYVMRWLLSLIRVEGMSLPDFWRGYRVSLTYDIIYSLIRWAFFAYLAFLYP